MLLFKPEHVSMILDGSKTETRRLWKSWRVKVGSIHQCRTRMLDKSSTFARIRVTHRWKEYLHDITEEGAKREGYESRWEFLKKFWEINWRHVDGVVTVHCVRFERVE